MRKEISEKIKVLGFLMTCAVVFYHCPTVDASYIRGSVDAAACTLAEHIVSQMGTFAMSHFFAVTGFLLFQNYTLKSYPQKIKRRVFSLLIPYVLWQCLTVALKLVLNGEVIPLGDFLRKTFLFARFPYNGALWYVYAVFFLALLSPLLLPLLRSRRSGWCWILVLITAVEAREQISNPAVTEILNYGYFWNIFTYLPAYLVGCFCGKFAGDAEETLPLKSIFSALFLAFLLEGILPGFFSGLTVKLMPLMALFLLPVIPNLIPQPVFQLTFLVYAVHQPLCGIVWSVLRRVYGVFPLPATVCNLLTRAIVLTAALCLAGVIHLVLKRLAPKALGLLTGGRF